jgi:recombination protein RecA
LVDLTIANRPNGGLPVGRITELTGLEASGKSLMGAHLLAETQKKGGLAVFIDTETSVSTDFLTAIGVDVPKMLYINVDTVEDVFDKVEEIITLVRKSSKNRLVTILVDSVAAASTKKELASDHGADGYATGKAIAISKAMRKITGLIAKQRVCLCFTNQLRQKVGFVGLGDPWINQRRQSHCVSRFASPTSKAVESNQECRQADGWYSYQVHCGEESYGSAYAISPNLTSTSTVVSTTSATG